MYKEEGKKRVRILLERGLFLGGLPELIRKSENIWRRDLVNSKSKRAQVSKGDRCCK
tara:strand:+ start:151 stop:321 length:171 start_codon:yes stop_codon:yes gene_type:complete